MIGLIIVHFYQDNKDKQEYPFPIPHRFGKVIDGIHY